MYTDKEILTRAWLVKEVVNIVLENEKLCVDKMFLIGSYAAGTPTEWSDIDFLVQLNGPAIYPSWPQMQEIHEKLDTRRIHVIFGTEEAQKSLQSRYKDMHYRKIQLEGVYDVTNSHSPAS